MSGRDAFIERMERNWELQARESRCVHCTYCIVHPAADMEALSEFVLGTVRSNLEPNDSTYRTQEDVERDIAAAVEEYRLRLAFCTCPELMEPVDGMEAWVRHRCDFFVHDAVNERRYREFKC